MPNNSQSDETIPRPVSGCNDAWLKAAVACWIVLVVAASVKSIVEPRLHTVYTTFSGAARDWWSGHSLYVGREFFYSPSFAVAMSPLALLPDWLGGVVWTCLSCGLLFYALRVFYREVLPASAWPAAAEGQFLILVLIGTVRSVWSGQSNALLVAMVLLAAAAIVRGRWWRGALWLAAPIHIKLWPVVAAVLFAAQSPRKLVGRLILCVAGLGMLPFIVGTPAAVAERYASWYRCLAGRQTGGGRYPGYRDAWTIWEQIHPAVDARAYMMLQLSGGLAVLTWCIWQKRRGLPARQLATYTIAAWSVWQLLLGPGTERLTYNLIAPALAWAVLTCFYTPRKSARHQRLQHALVRPSFWQCAWITTAFTTTYLLGVGGVERILIKLAPAATALEPLGVLVFAAWLVQHAATAEPWSTEPATDLSSEPIPAPIHGRAA